MKLVDRPLLAGLGTLAAAAPRLRANHNLHESPKDAVQRFLNAIEPGSYVRPHRHSEPDRWELLLALEGTAVVLLFDDAGCVVERMEISAGGPVRGVEIPGGTWHTLASLEGGTVLFELKPGPYRVAEDKDFAAWAPGEGGGACPAYEAWFRAARPGDGPDDVRCPSA